ncbi:MAG: Rrf2 family transcriptional regulator [Candidatus Omnitrophota bacterium]|nr:Rrf2 family transcriptional regulator [Candidatus Omnitrophota bacterium]
MKLITKNSDYAIRAMLALANSKKCFLSARQISKEQNVPYQFLRVILRKLIRNNMVFSREGINGGFKINVDPKKVSITDIIKIFQGNVQLSECMFRRRLCVNRARCILRKEIRRVEQVVEKEFRGITLGRLVRNQKQ